jgi:hypothetical protein
MTHDTGGGGGGGGGGSDLPNYMQLGFPRKFDIYSAVQEFT